jgi:hypothetical protein
MGERLLNMDRRIIYLVLFLVVLLPFLLHWQQAPRWINPWTQALYNYIEGLPPGTPVLISFDYDPAVKPELQPMAMALSRHVLRRDLRLVGMTMHPGGVLLTDEVLGKVAGELGKRWGEDYVNLGYKPGGSNVLLSLGESLKRTFPTDAHLQPTAAMRVLRGVRNYKDLGLVISISGSSLPGAWIAFAHQRYKAPVATGVTSVSATDFYVYLRTKQLVGMINGIAGAAEYEALLRAPDQAVLGLPGVSAVHLLMVLLVIIGNLAYFTTRRRGARPSAPASPPPPEEEV